MSKMHKVWLWIFAGMFLVPEILWKPVGNLFYVFIQNSNHPKFFRMNFLTQSNPQIVYKSMVAFELLGLIGFMIVLIVNRNKISGKIFYLFLLFISIILLLLTFFTFYIINFVTISLL